MREVVANDVAARASHKAKEVAKGQELEKTADVKTRALAEAEGALDKDGNAADAPPAFHAFAFLVLYSLTIGNS